MKSLILFICFLALIETNSSAQSAAITLEITDAEYRNGKLGFRMTMYNNSKDTIHIIDAGALRFVRNTRVFTAEEMGLKQLPYSITGTNFIPCPEKIQALEWPEKRRKSIDPELFVSIAPGDERRLKYSEFKDIDFCAKPNSNSVAIKVTYKVAVNPNYFTPDQVKELASLIKECESVESELPVSDLSATKTLLKFYQGYQRSLNRLYTGTIVSKEVNVPVK
jgi:hypothetical protein